MKGRVVSRSHGSWTIIYDLPPDGARKRKQKYETFKGITKKQAEQKLRDRLTALDNGSYIPVAKETVARFLEKWLETHCATNTTLRTQMGYRQYLNCYVIPAVGNVELQKLTPRQIQNIYAGMLKRGLSNTTVSQLHRILHKALGTAVKWGMIARNPTDAVTAPRPADQEMAMWDEDTIWRFLEEVRGTRFADFYSLAILTGMRRSELCGLQWEQTDLPGRRLSVVRTLQRITGYGLVAGQPKTRRSRRSISMGPEAVTLLHAIRGWQMEQQLKVGELWQDTGYVFTDPEGRPVIPDQVTQDFARKVRKLGFPHLTLKGLRHGYATLMLTDGVNLKVVSEALGHSSIAITGDIYSHVLPGLHEEAALRLEQRLFRNRRPATE